MLKKNYKNTLPFTIALIFFGFIFSFNQVEAITCNSGDLNTTCYINTLVTATPGENITGSGNLVIQSGGQLNSDVGQRFYVNLGGNITVESGGSITGNMVSTSTNLYINSGGSINVNGKGYLGATSILNNGQGPGGGVASGIYADTSGAGHGGRGGTSAQSGNLGGVTYGDLQNPTNFGSGGAKSNIDSGNGGNGGGAISIYTSNSVSVNGTLSANGANGGSAENGHSGGSGGSILIKTGTLTGSGSVTVIGGSGGNALPTRGGSGGGGGRIAMILSVANYFSGITHIVGGGYGTGNFPGNRGNDGTLYSTLAPTSPPAESPSSKIIFPTANSLYYSSTTNITITGTSSGGTISSVEVSIKRVEDDVWIKSDYTDSESEVFIPATGTTTWSFVLNSNYLDPYYTYQIKSRAKTILETESSNLPTVNIIYDPDSPIPNIGALCDDDTTNCTGYGMSVSPKEVYNINAVIATATDPNSNSSGIASYLISIKDLTASPSKWYKSNDQFSETTDGCSSISGVFYCLTSTESVVSISNSAFTTDHLYEVKILAVDNAQNISSTPASSTFLFKNVVMSPTVTINSASQQSNGTVLINFDITSSLSSTTDNYVYRNNGSLPNAVSVDEVSQIELEITSGLVAPSEVLIGDEIIGFTGINGNLITGITRGLRNTVASSIDQDTDIGFLISNSTGAGTSNATTSKNISWNVNSDIPNSFNENLEIYLLVDGGNKYYSAEIASTTLRIDTSRPSIATTSIVIDATSTEALISFGNSIVEDSDYMIRVGTSSDLSGIDFSSSSSSITSTTISNLTSSDDVYVEIKDIYSNSITLSKSVYPSPENILVQDITTYATSTGTSSAILVSWDSVSPLSDSSFSRYRILRSVNNGSYDYLGSTVVGDVNSNYFRDNTASSSNTYRYKVYAEDNLGNKSPLSIASGIAFPDSIKNYGEVGAENSVVSNSTTTVVVIESSSSNRRSSGGGSYVKKNNSFLATSTISSYDSSTTTLNNLSKALSTSYLYNDILTNIVEKMAKTILSTTTRAISDKNIVGVGYITSNNNNDIYNNYSSNLERVENNNYTVKNPGILPDTQFNLFRDIVLKFLMIFPLSGLLF